MFYSRYPLLNILLLLLLLLLLLCIICIMYINIPVLIRVCSYTVGVKCFYDYTVFYTNEK